MTRIFWPTELQTRQSRWILLGRVMHWTLTAIALSLLALTVAVSGALLEAGPGEGGIWGDPAVRLSFTGSLLGIGVFLLGRTLRFVFARE